MMMCSLLYLLLLVTLLLAELAVRVMGTCPTMCSCIWRNGKQTALCEKQGLISIPSGILSTTQVLNLNKNNFQILPSKVFQERGLINLQKVFLAECKLGVIADDAFTQLTNLIELDLSANLLTHVPTLALKDCFNLRRLQLNSNPISVIRAEAFLPLAHLKSLDMSGSQLDLVESGAFKGLEKLEFLKLDGNRLTTLAPSVVSDLPALYSFDLHRNPWNCDCDLRLAREWMLRNNVPQSIPPTCHSPNRVSGLMWNSLDIDDFACAPDILSTITEVTKYVGGNATLSCHVKGLPEPKIFWYVDDGFYRNLSSHLVRGEKFFLVEERAEGIINSMLTIAGLEETDSQSFICSAENRAGLSTKNFTITVLPLPFGVVAGWSKVEVAGGVVGVLISLIFIFVLITILLIRTRRNTNVANSKHSSIATLKNLSPAVKVENSGYKSHVTVIGKDGTEKKHENGNSSGYGSGGMTPDLTKTGFDVINGYHHHNISSNSYHENQFGNQLLPISYQSQSSQQISPGAQSFNHLSANDMSQNFNYNYENYQEVYDADGYCTGLPPSVAATAFPPSYHNYQNQSFQDDDSHHINYDHQSYYDQQQQQYNNYLTQPLQHQQPPQQHELQSAEEVGEQSSTNPSQSNQNQWKRNPVLGAPTVVRYSPDEGYAEEGTPFHLEGTEV